MGCPSDQPARRPRHRTGQALGELARAPLALLRDRSGMDPHGLLRGNELGRLHPRMSSAPPSSRPSWPPSACGPRSRPPRQPAPWRSPSASGWPRTSWIASSHSFWWRAGLAARLGHAGAGHDGKFHTTTLADPTGRPRLECSDVWTLLDSDLASCRRHAASLRPDRRPDDSGPSRHGRRHVDPRQAQEPLAAQKGRHRRARSWVSLTSKA